MILNYFGISLKQYSQATVDYIDSALTTTSNRYNLLSLESNFGVNNNQLVIFQDYVNQSINPSKCAIDACL